MSLQSPVSSRQWGAALCVALLMVGVPLVASAEYTSIPKQCEVLYKTDQDIVLCAYDNHSRVKRYINGRLVDAENGDYTTVGISPIARHEFKIEQGNLYVYINRVMLDNIKALKFYLTAEESQRVYLCEYQSCVVAPSGEYETAENLKIPITSGKITGNGACWIVWDEGKGPRLNCEHVDQ